MEGTKKICIHTFVRKHIIKLCLLWLKICTFFPIEFKRTIEQLKNNHIQLFKRNENYEVDIHNFKEKIICGADVICAKSK